MIYFRGRKYQQIIDCSFFVKDGPNISSLEQYMVGDRVSLMVDVGEKIREAINEHLGVNKLSKAVDTSRALTGNPDKSPITLHFRVVDRRHTLNYRQVGNLSELGTSIYLEAEDGFAEDIFRWIFSDFKEKPTWVE